MIFKYLKISFREIKKHSFLTTINILGLAVGLCASLLLVTYVHGELGYDTFNTKADRIYKLNVSVKSENQSYTTDINRAAAKDAIVANVPEVEAVAKIYVDGYNNIYVDNQRYISQKTVFADPEILDILTFTPLYGDLKNSLSESNGVIINERTSKKFFGDINPIGKSFTYYKATLTVKCVIKDIPKKSHYDFDVVIPMNSLPYLNHMGGLEFVTYLLFKEATNHNQVINKCITQADKVNNELFGQWSATCTSSMQKLTDVYLHSDYSSKMGAQGNMDRVYLYSIIAMFILLIAIINYINLFTAHYKSRIKDFSIHKVFGAERKDLFMKLTTTSGLLTVIAAILALILTQLLIPNVSSLLQKKIEFSLISLPGLWFVFITIITAILSGIYPAIIISRQPIQNTIKGDSTTKSKHGLTGALVIFQFAISIIIIITSTGIVKQIDYLKSFDLGYSPQSVIVAEGLNREIKKNIDAINNKLQQSPMVVQVTGSVHSPAGGTSGQSICLSSKGNADKIGINEYRVHPGYFSALGIQIYQGRAFDKDITTDKMGVVLNQTAAKALGEDNLIGKKVNMGENVFTIIGIAKDYNYFSLHEKIDPLMYTNYNPNTNYIIIKTLGNATKSTVDFVNNTIKDFDPTWETATYILHDMVLRNYQSEDRIKKLVIYGGIISIILSLLGLFALSLFMLKKKSKEIGIRKVNGATVAEIIFMLNKTYLRWMSISFIIAAPIAYIILTKMMQNYAYKTIISWWIFAMAGVIVLFVTSATVWIQTYKTAKQNPVEVLKDE
ncbi:MAG: ABC transporter permease [Bacteroidales bacterium]|nr:ABC transporter permease [Bacteroidales bacterium]